MRFKAILQWGILGLVIAVATLGYPILGFHALKSGADPDLFDWVSPTSIIGGFLLTGLWVVFLIAGVMLGIFHRWLKDEGIWRAGLEEYSRWRRGEK